MDGCHLFSFLCTTRSMPRRCQLSVSRKSCGLRSPFQLDLEAFRLPKANSQTLMCDAEVHVLLVCFGRHVGVIRREPAVPKVDGYFGGFGQHLGQVLVDEKGVKPRTRSRKAGIFGCSFHQYDFRVQPECICIAAGRDLPQKDAAFPQGLFDAIQAVAICFGGPGDLFSRDASRSAVQFLGCKLNKLVPIVLWTISSLM